VTAIATTGMTVEWNPSARPKMIFGAAPVMQDFERF
jgi:hypothetical protein